jgi:hypothetical protein
VHVIGIEATDGLVHRVEAGEESAYRGLQRRGRGQILPIPKIIAVRAAGVRPIC